jgi:hypothetical protein
VGPGVRLMAVSRSDVERARAGMPSRPTDRVHLQRVVLWEEQPTVGTAPTLPCEPGGPAGTDCRVASPSGAPRDPIPSVGTPMACDRGVPQTGALTRRGESDLALRGGRWGEPPAGVPSRPVPVIHPPGRGGGVSPAGPVAERHPREMIHPTAGGWTHPGARSMGPAAARGVALAAPGGLGPGPPAAHDPPELRQMRLDGGLGGCEQRVDPEPRVASGAVPGVVGSHPRLTEGEPQTVPAGRIAFPGVADVRVRPVPRQAERCQPGPDAVRAVVADEALRMEDQAVLGGSHDAGLRIALGDGRVHPLQGDPRPPR